jgi:hypothetical protein
MSESSNSGKGQTALVLAIIGVFAIFLIILQVVRNPVTPLDQADNVPEEEQWKLTPEGRKARLAEVRGREVSAATGYSWVNKEEGVVLLPVEQAMKLTIDEINARKK